MERQIFRILLAAIFIMQPSPSFAQAEGLVGEWAVRSDGQTVMIITVRQNGGRLIATKLTSQKGYINQGHAAVEMSGPLKATEVREIRRSLNSVELAPQTDPTDINVLTLAEPDLMTFGYKSAPSFEPILFTRARKGEAVALNWSAQTDWMLDERWPDNAVVERLFADDQAIRQAGSKIDWNVARFEDAKRREAVQILLDEGKLRSGTDFYHAAYIFQHGREPGDFLKAHGLAIIAAAKGRRDAAWIAAATLDRYLQNIGQKQVYGTQYRVPENEPATQEPYDRKLFSDAMRAASGVPDLATQEQRRKEMETESSIRNPVAK
jgi:hypothetical protein